MLSKTEKLFSRSLYAADTYILLFLRVCYVCACIAFWSARYLIKFNSPFDFLIRLRETKRLDGRGEGAANGAQDSCAFHSLNLVLSGMTETKTKRRDFDCQMQSEFQFLSEDVSTNVSVVILVNFATV